GEAVKSGGTFWLDITAPNTEDLNLLANVFKIHPLTVEDILTEEIREKCELFKNYYFVSIRTLITDSFTQSSLKSQNFYLLIFKNGIISFHSNMVPHINNVLKRITQLKDFINLNSDWINYALIDDIIDGFGPILRQSELEVDTIDELVLILKESEQSDMLRRIGHARKRVTTLLRLLSTKPDVIKALTVRCGTEDRLASSTKTDIKLYLGDIQDHVLTMVQNCLHYEKVLSRAHSNYLAQISIELTQVSNRTNDVVAKLTVMASILLPMNVITGMWGMNVRVPGENVENLDWFFGICGCMLVLAL
ncbi:Mg2+ transporter protein, partial [Conidiobolus coronatus NRRL 28638]